MTTEFKLQEARRNLALVWGKDGIHHYVDLGFEFKFEEHTGESESTLWDVKQVDIKEAWQSVDEAVDELMDSLATYQTLSQATSFYFESLKIYWLLNLTFDGDLASSLESIVVEAYDYFRMRGETFEDSETKAELCAKEAEQFLSEVNKEELFQRMIDLMAR
jgi:hypothetical protein